MRVTPHKASRFRVGRLLSSSAGRRWRGLSAELRSHIVSEIPPYVPPFTEIAVLIRGATVVTRKAGRVEQRIVGSPGTIGLCPVGLREDVVYIEQDIDEMLHVCLLPSSFEALAKHTSQHFSPTSVHYVAGFNDPLIETIAAEIVGEMNLETSCGDILIETLADTLAARLLNTYSSFRIGPEVLPRTNGLDPRRLRRTVDYIQANIMKPITVGELAAAAALSRFHFTRMFKATLGQSPSRFIGQLKLELAKSLLLEGRSIADVANDCGFSSESNFVRSFRRATGLTPGQHRDLARK